MSKWVLPDQEGDELWPRPTRQPLVVRVTGVTEGADVDGVAERYAPQINHFYLGASRRRAQSGLEVFKLHWQPFADVAMTYTYMHGLEYLDIEVSSGGEGGEKLQDYWDWALIDIHVPNYHFTNPDGGVIWSQPVFMARLPGPKVIPDPLISPPVPIAGEAGLQLYDEATYSAENLPILQWASTTSLLPQVLDRSVDGSEWVGSLIVDVRNMHSFEEVTLELWGSLLPVADDYYYTPLGQVGYWIRQLASTPDDLENGGVPTPDTLTGSQVVLTTSGNPYTDYYHGHQPADYPSPYPQRGGGFYTTTPALSPGSFTPVWGDFYPGGMAVYDDQQGKSYNYPVDSTHTLYEFHENVLHYEFYPVYDYEPVYFPMTPSSLATVKGMMFKGTPKWGWSQEDCTGDFGNVYWQWEDRDLYPDRPAPGFIGSRQMAEIDTNYYHGGTRGGSQGLQLMGHLHILPRLGSVTFTAA